MRHLAIVLILLLPLATAAQQVPKHIRAALGKYTTLAGGLFLNEKCNFVDGERAEAFTRNERLINRTLGEALGIPEVMKKLRDSAEEFSEQENYQECAEDAKELIDYANRAAHEWSEEIRSASVGGSLLVRPPAAK